MMDHVPPGWLNGRTAAAQYLGVSRRSISRWMRSGILPHRKLSSKLVLFRVRDLDSAIERLANDFAERSR